MAQPISFLFFISPSIILDFTTLSSTTAFLFCLSIYMLHSFPYHISYASSRFCSFRSSATYNATFHTTLFTGLFLCSFSKVPQKMLLFLLEVYFAIAILCFTSWQQFMLLLILHPKYLKLSTCSTDSPLIRMSIFFGFLPITMVLVLFIFIFIP